MLTPRLPDDRNPDRQEPLRTSCSPDLRWSLPVIPCELACPSSRMSERSIADFILAATRYGSSCNLILTTGQGVNGYTLDPALGEFILTHPDVSLPTHHNRVIARNDKLTLSISLQIRIPSRGKIYSFNEGNSSYFHEPVTKYLDLVKNPSPESGRKPYSARYIGSMGSSLFACSFISRALPTMD